MSNKQFGITVFAIGFGLMSFICAVTFMVMAKDLRDQVIEYEESGCLIHE